LVIFFDNAVSESLTHFKKECTDAVLNALEDHAVNYSEFFFTKTLFLIMNYIQARKVNSLQSQSSLTSIE